MTQINNENEQQHYISSPEFRPTKFEFNQIPFRCREGSCDIQITEHTCFLGSDIHIYIHTYIHT